MGIKTFSKVFEKSAKEIKIKDLKNKTIAVDASIIMFKSCLGMNNIHALTDSDGNPTAHINILIAKLLNFKKAQVNPLFVFDFHEKNYINVDKTLEHAKRNKIKENAKKNLTKLNKKRDELFSSDEDEDEDEEEEKKIKKEIHSQEKIAFSLNETIVSDTIFILNSFNIPWCISYKGVEAEALCAKLNQEGVCDLVWSTDTDTMAYSANEIIRDLKIKTKKVLISYKLNDILHDNNINMDEFLKICVILGTDHNIKTKGIGPKTIFKKFKDIELTDDQKNAIKIFTKPIDISNLEWNNMEQKTSEFNKDKIEKLLDWLETKSFNRERIIKQINKV